MPSETRPADLLTGGPQPVPRDQAQEPSHNSPIVARTLDFDGEVTFESALAEDVLPLADLAPHGSLPFAGPSECAPGVALDVVATPLQPQVHLGAHIHELHIRQLAFGRQIGEGGFGKVYAGHWRRQPVAIKVVAQHAPLDGSLLAEFHREVSTMVALPQHPNVLPLLAACTRPPHLALVTPYCARGSLYSMLHDPSLHLSWRHIIQMALGAARGMAHLHAFRILHRDLKSGNLLVTGDWTVKVADFGLSRVVADLNTMTGGLGTYQWMSPEVLGHQRYSYANDAYSFGIVLWETASRALPFAGLNGMQAAMAVMNRGLRPEIPRGTPPPLASLMQACWAPAAASRPSFPEIVAALEGMLAAIGGPGDL